MKKRVYLKIDNCCVKFFNELMERLTDVLFSEQEVYDSDAKHGYVVFEIDPSARVDFTAGKAVGEYMSTVWDTISTEEEIERLKLSDSYIPHMCEGCQENARRLRQGLLPLPRKYREGGSNDR